MKIRVLIIEDSSVVRTLLEYTINNDPRLEVAASVETAEEALELLESVSPNVISMDIHLPGMNGLDATKRIMAIAPTPIVIVSTTTRTRDAAFTMEALKAGALSVVEKPTGTTHEKFAAMAERLCTQLAAMSQVKVVRQRESLSLAGKDLSAKPLVVAPSVMPKPNSVAASCVGIVASTGGPNAVTQVLNGLGRDFPLPILLVQHMTLAFIETFVAWLDQTTPFSVGLARNGGDLEPGHVYHAPPDCHLLVRQGHLSTSKSTDTVTVHRPSGDVLFRSMAAAYGAAGIGVLLTGMGNDGAAGLTAMHALGAYTIAEDASTAVVNGMPEAAAKMGGVTERLPIGDIAGRLREISTRRQVAAQ